ncbi:hypothetical protein DV515_00014896, partial [Chloebia gouldiae]
ENEKHEKLCLEREQEQKKAGKASVPRANSTLSSEEPRSELLVPISPPGPVPLPPPPLAAPISVIPIPVVTSSPQQAAQAALSPPLVQRHQPLVSAAKEAPSVAPVIQRPPGPHLPDGKAAPPPSGSPQQLPHYAAPVLAISQHHVVPQPIQPLQHPPAPAPLGALKLAPADDMKPIELKKRIGGPELPGTRLLAVVLEMVCESHGDWWRCIVDRNKVHWHVQIPKRIETVKVMQIGVCEDKGFSKMLVVGTREVHNKLEKNRRAHLKECFETLKRNIPNVDDKKTSNLSVLRSALRYIQ